MKKIEPVTIDGDLYTMTQLGGVEGVALFHDLRKLVLPVLTEVITGPDLAGLLTGKVEADKIDPATLGKLMALVLQLFQSMPKALELELALKFAQNCTVVIGEVAMPLGAGGLQPGGTFDQHFAGRYVAYQKWLLHGLKFNFASFLGSSGSSGSPANLKTP